MHDPLSLTELELLEQYAAGVADDAQRAQVHDLLARRPDVGERLALIKRHLLQGTPEPVSVDRSWEQFRARVGMVPESKSAATTVRPGRPSFTAPRTTSAMSSRAIVAWSGTLLAAAALLGIALLRRADTHDRQGVKRYATAVGQRATVTLADGSRVTLAPQTTLVVDGSFGTNSRTVSLVGQAYFAVSHVSGAPFVVRTETARTRVLGTTFVVRRYAGDVATRVSVLDGRVMSEATDHIAGTSMRGPIVLAAGMTGVIGDSVDMTVAQDTSTMAPWVNGRLVFNNAPAAEVLREVHRWCGYQFHIADSSLVNQRVTITLVIANPQELLGLLANVLDASMTFDSNVVTLHGRRTHDAMNKRRDPRALFPIPLEIGK